MSTPTPAGTEDLTALRRSFRDLATCRIATVRPDGGPHVAARWFVWLEDAIWVATRVGDATWRHAGADPRVSVLLDRGRDWTELSGLRAEGVAEELPAEHPDLRGPMSAWHEKYRGLFGPEGFERFTEQVPELGFLRVVPSRIEVWDHRGARGG
ncbi:MAG: pyridoxamine 5'-phosphate oxidase [Actinomycetota bacterium]|nr:MAG: pyridoxamine 5'-phosphate oxidase [Actinomycetota bacterium]